MNIYESELFYTVSLCSLVLAQQINLDGVNRGCFIDCVIHPICPCVYLGSGSSYQGGVLCEKKEENARTYPGLSHFINEA